MPSEQSNSAKQVEKVNQLSAIEAASFFESHPDALYVDVRTVAEFALGHPKLRCVNIPMLFRYPTTDKTLQNDAFLLVASHALSETDKLIIGSERNARAHQAYKVLEDSGFSKIGLLIDGHLGWMKSGMPTTGDNRDGVSYASLLTGARRTKKNKTE